MGNRVAVGHDLAEQAKAGFDSAVDHLVIKKLMQEQGLPALQNVVLAQPNATNNIADHRPKRPATLIDM